MEKRTNIIEDYYETKKHYLKHKINYDNNKLLEIRKANEQRHKIIELLKNCECQTKLVVSAALK